MAGIPSNKFEGKPCRNCGGMLRYRTKKPGGRCVQCVAAHTKSVRTKHKASLSRHKRGATLSGDVCLKCGSVVRYVSNGKCVSCSKEIRQRYNAKQPKGFRNKYKSRYPKSSRTRQALGISHAGLKQLENNHKGRCAICDGEPKFPRVRLCVDHDHITGYFRGLLCGHCNTALGMFKDRPELLRKAADYLENNGWAL